VNRLSCESGEHRQLFEVSQASPGKTLRTHILQLWYIPTSQRDIKNPASMSSSPWQAEYKYVQILKFGHVLGELCVPEHTRQLAPEY
jgi:hypothetical protein